MKVPGLERIGQTEAFRAGVAKLAAEENRPADLVAAEATSALEEMAALHTRAPVAAWSRLGDWMMRAYEPRVDTTALAELRRLDDDHTLVWMPSHRSYLDMWALPAALDDAGFPPYFVLGGINLDFWPFGDIAKRTGLVFIRRKIRDDPVYRFALRQYLAHLVADHSDFGWSIEGGRTRTGKLRPPRYGLLRYLVDTVHEEDARDVLLVPVSIVYDTLQEVPAMAAEARGARKRPEDVRWLLDFARRQGDQPGRVYIDFGEPIALADRLDELRAEDPGGTHEVERIALQVCHRINAVTRVIPSAVVTIALLAADRALTLDELVERVAPLEAYLDRRGHPVACAARFADRTTIESTLDELVRAGAAIRFAGGREPVWSIGPEQHLVAAFYRNSALHFLVDRAIAEVAADVAAGEPDQTARREAGWREALRLRDLMKFEFFFPRKRDFFDVISQEIELIDSEDGEGMKVAALVLRPFLESYLVVADELATRRADQEIDADELVRACLAVGHQWLLQRRLASEESVSLELFRTAVKLIRNRGLWEPASNGGDLVARRRAFAHELRRDAGRLGADDRDERDAGPRLTAEVVGQADLRIV